MPVTHSMICKNQQNILLLCSEKTLHGVTDLGHCVEINFGGGGAVDNSLHNTKDNTY